MDENFKAWISKVYSELGVDLVDVMKHVRSEGYDSEAEIMQLFCRILSNPPAPAAKPAPPAYVERQESVFSAVRNNYLFEKSHQSM